MDLWKSLSGIVRIRVTSASLSDTLSAVNSNGITLFQVQYINDLTIVGCVYRRDYYALHELISKRGERLDIIQKIGLYWIMKGLLCRPILILGTAVILLLTLFLPTRVFFIEVEGNISVPDRLIIEKAEGCGIVFGASRREVRSEKMKNALLAAIPELQWAGINTNGCVAIISVKERSAAETVEATKGVSSIVASRDGIITECTVLRGTPLCRVGQVVKEGQVLVSGYTDCGISIQATRAEAEIIAQTLRDLDVITPSKMTIRGECIKEETRYCLLIGKKQINFFKDSGISDITCGKMYGTYYLTLPGGFLLPVALVSEKLFYYDDRSAVAASKDSFEWMNEFSAGYLQSHMLAGQILSADASFDLQEDVCRLYGNYACLEVIGRVQAEEIIKGNGKDD